MKTINPTAINSQTTPFSPSVYLANASLPDLEKMLADLDAEESREKPEKPENSGGSAGNSPEKSRESAENPTEEPLPKNYSILNALPPADQRFVMDLLESRTLIQTKRKLAWPRPLGLGIRVSISALHRFQADPRIDDVVEESDIAVEQAQVILEVAAETDLDFIKAAKHLLKVRLLKTSMSPTAQTAEIRDLFRILDRLRATDLAERRLQLAEQKQKPTDPVHPVEKTNSSTAS